MIVSGASYFALWKARQHKLQSTSRCVPSGLTHSIRASNTTTRAPTASILSHVITENETETETDLSLQKLETGNNLTDDEDVWASATSSPGSGFAVKSHTRDRNSTTSCADRNSPDTGLAGSSNVVESSATSFDGDIASVTSFGALLKSPDTTDRLGVSDSNKCAAVVSPITSFNDDDDPASSINDGYFLDRKLNGNNDCAAAEFPLTSSAVDGNPVTSRQDGINSSTNDDCRATQSTGSSYPETGSDVTKLILATGDDDGTMILHRIQIPTVGEVLGEMGVVETSSIHSAGSSETTTDYSMALLNDSMLDVNRSCDVVNDDGEPNHQMGDAWTLKNDQGVLMEQENVAATTTNNHSAVARYDVSPEVDRQHEFNKEATFTLLDSQETEGAKNSQLT